MMLKTTSTPSQRSRRGVGGREVSKGEITITRWAELAPRSPDPAVWMGPENMPLRSAPTTSLLQTQAHTGQAGQQRSQQW